jgi:hypothetical protein
MRAAFVGCGAMSRALPVAGGPVMIGVDGNLIVAVKEIERTSDTHGKLKCTMPLKGVCTLVLNDGNDTTWEITISDYTRGPSSMEREMSVGKTEDMSEVWIPYTFTYKQK